MQKNKDLFERVSQSDQDILDGNFLNEEKNKDFGDNNVLNDKDLDDESVDILNPDDFFKGVKIEEVEAYSNLGANIFDGVKMDGNYVKAKTGVVLYKLTGNIDFSGNIEDGGLVGQPLVLGSSDKVNGFKIAFKNQKTLGVFDSISYKGYGVENTYVQNGKIKFDLFFDGVENTEENYILKSVFTGDDNFLTQVKISEKKKMGGSYKTLRIKTETVSQAIIRDDGKKLIEWPCLSSDFTYVKDDFRDKKEQFLPDFYEKTNTGYVLDDAGNWDKDNGEVLSSTGLCAFNDTYNYVKGAVVGSQCWEGEDYGGGKNDVGRLVYRVKKGSFCTPAASIKEEKNYPKYACNIETEKDFTDKTTPVQKYLGGDVAYLTGSTVDGAIFTYSDSLHYTCGDHN